MPVWCQMKHMTPDALLAILLNVCIPCLLAVCGGVLAVRALPVSKARERFVWIAVFVGIAVLGIVLAFFQQVRITMQQQMEDRRTAARELQTQSASTYTQGQLDSINKILSVFVANSSGSPLGDRKVLEALLSASASAKEHAQSSSAQNQASAPLRERLLTFSAELSSCLGEQSWLLPGITATQGASVDV